MNTKKILIIVTNVDAIDKNHPTGVWLEEFSIPYNKFLRANYDMTIASPIGGKAPVDPLSIPEKLPKEWQPALDILNDTKPLADIPYENFDAVIIPGGHGPMLDLAKNTLVAKIILYFASNNKLIASICHGAAALTAAVDKNNRSILVDRNITGFTNEEESFTKLDKILPFSLEDKLKQLGARYIKNGPWQEHIVIDGNLITGQNPQSSALFTKAVIDNLNT
ncbi:type 1 glutamine amidotransferase domain-containing protein [Pectinatus sottacetonis]|uniref:type 1 glutamine amidotransferase domain-containing protein n=1 Tax=Pectinatus sottacetonis TaxID=1002795 RepID=UPI0018C6D4E2|nr:type 1 glutamine amidotransferase domain-containing protein [Pectinatus sottacetonis]